MANHLFRFLLSRQNASRIGDVIYSPSLRYRDFRLLFASTVFNGVSFLGKSVVVGWILLELTGSPFMVAAGFGIRLAPSFFLGLIAGAVADKFDRHLLLRLLNIGQAAIAGIFAALIYFGLVEVWHIFVMLVIEGSLMSAINTTRQSYAYDIVGPANAINGLSVVSIGTRLGGITGSLVTGFIIAQAGADIAFATIGIFHLLSAGVMLFVHSSGQSAPVERQNVWENLKEFGIEIRSNSILRILMIIVAFIEIFGFSSLALMPNLAADVLEVGADGLGLMNAISAVGGIVGSLVLSSIAQVPRKGMGLIVVTHVMGAGLILLGTANSFVVAIFFIFIVNVMMAFSDILSQSIMQTVVRNELRGRSMGAWAVAIGLGPIGNLQIGAVASAFGVGIALGLSGLGLVLVAIITLITASSLRRI